MFLLTPKELSFPKRWILWWPRLTMQHAFYWAFWHKMSGLHAAQAVIWLMLAPAFPRCKSGMSQPHWLWFLVRQVRTATQEAWVVGDWIRALAFPSIRWGFVDEFMLPVQRFHQERQVTHKRLIHPIYSLPVHEKTCLHSIIPVPHL